MNAVANLSGLDTIRAIAAGDLAPPPLAVLLGITLVDVQDGETTFHADPDDRMTNPQGTVHGGVTAALLDTCMGAAVHTTLTPGFSYTTLQLNVHYLRPIMPGAGLIRAVGKVLHRGKSQRTAEGRVLDADGRILAHASTTCMVLGG